jgi:hypothetical protein
VRCSNQTHLLQDSILAVIFVASFPNINGNTDNRIGTKGAMQLFEALESNSSLKFLNLWGNRLVASFHSHSKQGIILVVKQQPNYPKHSNQTHLLHHLNSKVNILLVVSFHNEYR